MLPDRSKRYVGLDGEAPRLQLVTYGQMVIITLMMALLLFAIFPRKALVEKLYEMEVLDAITLAYIDNLARTDPDNADLAILLARTQGERLDLVQLRQRIGHIVASEDVRQRNEARLLMLRAIERTAEPDPAKAESLRDESKRMVADASSDPITDKLSGAFAAAAFRLGMTDTGDALLRRLGVVDTVAVLETYARDALAERRYTLAAEYYLLARRQASDRGQARRLFQEGIGVYLADSQFAPALRAMDKHLGDLKSDPATLRFAIRTSLAAGAPRRAAGYAQMLVFSPDTATVRKAP